MMKRFAACKEQDKGGDWIVHCVVSDDGKGLPEGWHCIELSGTNARKDHVDFPRPGDVWQEKQQAFQKKSDQRAELKAAAKSPLAR